MIPFFIWFLTRVTKGAFDVLAHFVWGKGSAIEEARQVFREYDQDNNGSLDIDELENALHDLKIEISRKRLEDVVAGIDDGDSWIGLFFSTACGGLLCFPFRSFALSPFRSFALSLFRPLAPFRLRFLFFSSLSLHLPIYPSLYLYASGPAPTRSPDPHSPIDLAPPRHTPQTFTSSDRSLARCTATFTKSTSAISG